MLTDVELATARQTSRDTMTAVVAIAAVATGPGGWDPTTGPTAPDPETALWSGPARIQALRATSSRAADAAEQLVTARTYKVALPHDAPDLPPGSRATVTSPPPEDPALAGKALAVTSCVLGGLGIERVLYCDLDATNQPGG